MRFVFTVGLLLSSIAIAGEPRLTLLKFLSQAERNDPLRKQIDVSLQQTVYNKDLQLPNRAINIVASSEQGFDTASDSITRVNRLRAERNFAHTGTNVVVERSTTIRPDREEDVSAVRLEQSLYRNMFGRNVRQQERIIDRENMVLELQAAEEYEDYTQSLIILYLDYKKAYLDLKLARESLKDAEKLRDEVRARFRSSIATQSELDKSELQVLEEMEQVRSRAQVFDSQWQQIASRLGKSQLSYPTASSQWRFSGQEIGATKLDELRIMRRARIIEQNTGDQTVLAGRDDDMEVTFVAGYQVDESVRFSALVNRREALLGLRIDVPIGDSVSRATQLRASQRHAASQLELANLKRQLLETRLVLQTRIKEINERLSRDRKKIELAERIYKDDERRYKIGRISLDRLLDTRQSLMAYRYQYENNLLEHNTVLVSWFAHNDRLLDVKPKLH